MDLITPLGFWQRYKAKIIDLKPNLTKYKNKDGAWTELTRDAAINAIVSGSLHWSTEYFRIDVIGYESHGTKWDWSLKIAFEHENEYGDRRWKDELCKLSHVVADLRVLAAYYDSTAAELAYELQQQLNMLEARSNRITRDPKTKWLFIFGPAGKSKEPDGKFLLYTLERGTARAIPLVDDTPLIPWSWGYDQKG